MTALSALVASCACNRTEEPALPSTLDSGSGATASASTGTAGGGETSLASAGQAAVPPKPVCTVALGEPAPVASKAASCPKDPTGNLKLPMGRIRFVDAPGAPSAEVELARDDAARERGLMYRTSMAPDQGMLFSWDDERVRSFWMHNTCIPLDMLYITKAGVISGILEQVPTLNEAPRRIDCPVAHVLELNAGWARAHGIQPGMKLAIDG